MDLSYVYIMASQRYGVLYVGVTTDLVKRIAQHKSGELGGFTEKYNVKRLVYYEALNGIELAISREKNIKAWKRDWKAELIEKNNPDWIDLFDEIVR